MRNPSNSSSKDTENKGGSVDNRGSNTSNKTKTSRKDIKNKTGSLDNNGSNVGMDCSIDERECVIGKRCYEGQNER